MERRLAAILAADVVGYSRLMGEDETGTLERLRSLRRELVQPKITECKGRIVKLMGDGLLAEFPSVVEAVQCAVDIQESIIGRESELPNERRIRLRIGVNLGVLPTKGITLPLISYGGSSVMMTCVAIALLLRISYEVRGGGKGQPVKKRVAGKRRSR